MDLIKYALIAFAIYVVILGIRSFLSKTKVEPITSDSKTDGLLNSMVLSSVTCLNNNSSDSQQKIMVKELTPLVSGILIKCYAKEEILESLQVGLMAVAHNASMIVWDLFHKEKDPDECATITIAATNLEFYGQLNDTTNQDLKDYFATVITQQIIVTQIKQFFVRIKIGATEQARDIAETSLCAVNCNNPMFGMQKIFESLQQIPTTENERTAND